MPPDDCWGRERLTGWFTLWLTDLVDDRLIQWWWSGWVAGWYFFLPGVQPLYLGLFHASLNSTPPAFLWRNLPRCYIWSLSVDLTLYNSSHSLVPLCESMISRDCSVFSIRTNSPGILSAIVCCHVAGVTQPLQSLFCFFRGFSWKSVRWINISLLHVLCVTSQRKQILKNLTAIELRQQNHTKNKRFHIKQCIILQQASERSSVKWI